MIQDNIFMTGNWEDLIILTYEIDKEILKKQLPFETELQLFEGKALISMVAFTFSKVKFFGIKVPFHQQFGEINFRFYVKSKVTGERGVVFLKEYAPKPLIAFVASKIYNEPFFYKTIKRSKKLFNDTITMCYNFPRGKVEIVAKNEVNTLEEGSLEHFIVDRYIAFVKFRKMKTARYKINHKPWKLHKIISKKIDDIALSLLPKELQHAKYMTTYFVNGSSISIEKGVLQHQNNNATVIN